MLQKLLIFTALGIFSQCWSMETLIESNEQELFAIAEQTNGGSGYKTANLKVLRSACLNFNKLHPNNKYKVVVPEFVGAPSNYVVETINELAGIDLRKLYADLNHDPVAFGAKLKEILLKIDGQKAIDLLDKKMGGELLKLRNESAAKSKKVMVRSTGREDTKKLANAGGNETIANVDLHRASIWSAMIQVWLSYFGDKSIAQQKLGEIQNQKVLSLFLPVLIQMMVGETKTSGIPTSGVLFSEDPETHILGQKNLLELL